MAVSIEVPPSRSDLPATRNILGGWMRRAVEAAMAVPGELNRITSIETLRYVTLLLLLRRRDLAVISIWHPSFLELLLDALPDQMERLVQDIAKGTCACLPDIPKALHGFVQAEPDPTRARELGRADATRSAALWPSLSIISCWADGHAEFAANALSAALPGVTIQAKGLLATEGVVSIPFDGKHPLAIRSHFFEFIDSAGKAFLASELEIGRTYEVVLTKPPAVCGVIDSAIL